MPEARIARNIAHLRERIAQAARRAGRTATDITLVAVSKTMPPEIVRQAYDAGIRHFGENYVQDALPKINHTLLQLPDIHWHFIGHLQTNKVRYVVGRFALIHSVDSLRIARALGQRAIQTGQQVPILLEVKIDPAATKFGLDADQVPDIAQQILHIPGVQLRGLMGMAPFHPDPEAARPGFRLLRQLLQQLPPDARQILSMGMSADFEVAIEEGANMIRIGTAIFGPRHSAPEAARSTAGE
ncbi:MAG: YggS family pyridoxal phosphate-dependent enzyme [Chloroherpetonaceae bacterium]|nr:YggS family pyridoxal phosphate-dependent enzyme [Chthonomonadaceae bacterium]MDW8207991.1 YggS family pyridoxal phosphate-dependent enzyme [Chloroherpetonaceae bacterium]